MQNLYPLKFKTIYKDKIWGGQKIRTVLGKDFSPLPNCGETWEISGVEGNVSVVERGHLKGKSLVELIEIYKGALVGNRVHGKYGIEFPLLVKFIDANDDLSIQVHPDDTLARNRHNSFGKTEMWYIFQADEGAKLISGFNRVMDKDTYLKYFNEGRLMEILNEEEAKADDVFFIPAGRVHTIGKGLLLAEIQQTSDVTYRIFDFDRVDTKGQKRGLHIQEALEAIDYKYYDTYRTTYPKRKNEVINLVTCPYFTTNRMHFDKFLRRIYTSVDSFVIYVVMEGKALLKTDTFTENITITTGDAVLIPACINQINIYPDPEIKMLESFVAESN